MIFVLFLIFLSIEANFRNSFDLEVHGTYNKGVVATDQLATGGYATCTMKSNLVANQSFYVVMTDPNDNEVFRCKANSPYTYSPEPKYRCLLTNEIFWFKTNWLHRITIVATRDSTYFEKSHYSMRINS